MAEQGGFGVVLKVMISTTLTAVANLLDVDFPAQEKELADMTAHPSAASTGYRSWIDSGVRSLTEFTAVLGWDDTESTHVAIVTAFDATTALSMSIEDPAGQEIVAFSGFIRSIGRTAKIGDGYKCNVAIQPTGAPTIT
jgi:hypothetical protein